MVRNLQRFSARFCRGYLFPDIEPQHVIFAFFGHLLSIRAPPESAHQGVCFYTHHLELIKCGVVLTDVISQLEAIIQCKLTEAL
jgi:hypothetical protein